MMTLQFRQVEGNGRTFRHIELSNLVSSVKFSNSAQLVDKMFPPHFLTFCANSSLSLSEGLPNL